MPVDKHQLYDDPEQFYLLGGSVTMRLTRRAAVEVCKRAARKGLAIARIEGGIWHAPGFEARVDCIWDATKQPVDAASARQNNEAALAYVESCPNVHDAFIITTWKAALGASADPARR